MGQAEDMIQGAKQKRLDKLRQAKDKAAEDLKVFSDEQEAKFQKETGSKAMTDPTAELRGATQTGIAQVNKDYDMNKEKAVKYITSKVLDVPLELTETQTQALKTG